MIEKFKYFIFSEGFHVGDDFEECLDDPAEAIKFAIECHIRKPDVHYFVKEERYIFNTRDEEKKNKEENDKV